MQSSNMPLERSLGEKLSALSWASWVIFVGLDILKYP